MQAFNMTDQEEELTVEQVAHRLRIHYRTVLKRIRSGQIRARIEGSEYRVTLADLEAYIRSTYPDRKDK